MLLLCRSICIFGNEQQKKIVLACAAAAVVVGFFVVVVSFIKIRLRVSELDGIFFPWLSQKNDLKRTHKQVQNECQNQRKRQEPHAARPRTVYSQKIVVCIVIEGIFLFSCACAQRKSAR